MKTAERGSNRTMKDLLAKFIACFPLKPLADPQYFDLWQDKGIHITADHCYSAIPHLADLTDDLWEKETEMIGIDLNEPRQMELMNLFVGRFLNEYEKFPQKVDEVQHPYQYYLRNPFFGPVDAEILYGMIRNFQPRKMIEVGSGFSSYLSAQAILENGKHGLPSTEFIAIECNPNDTLKRGVPGLTRLIEQRIEKVPFKEFESLRENDILFIDSSHTVRIGGDVQYLFLEILPRLHKGVLVHIHDIFFPREYPRAWVMKDHFFWAEQYVLQAFLSFNRAYEILWCGSFMHCRHPQELAKFFKSYSSQADLVDLPKSFWMQRR